MKFKLNDAKEFLTQMPINYHYIPFHDGVFIETDTLPEEYSLLTDVDLVKSKWEQREDEMIFFFKGSTPLKTFEFGLSSKNIKGVTW